MSARASRSRRRARSAATRRRRRWPWLLLLLPIAIGVVARTLPRSRPRPPAAAEPAIESLTPEQAYNRGLGLGIAGHAVESLPYLRKAASSPDAGWMVHHDYSSALHNASVSSRARGAGMETANRTSLDRIALLRAALDELDVAGRLATDPAQQALVHMGRARSLAEWGLPIEALEEYRAAAALDPTSAEAKRRSEQMLSTVERPTN